MCPIQCVGEYNGRVDTYHIWLNTSTFLIWVKSEHFGAIFWGNVGFGGVKCNGRVYTRLVRGARVTPPSGGSCCCVCAGLLCLDHSSYTMAPRWLRGSIHVYVARGTQIAGGGGSQ